MNELKNQLLNKDVKVVYDAKKLIGKKIIGAFDEYTAYNYIADTLTLIVTEDKYLYMNLLEEDYDGITRERGWNDCLMDMVDSDYPDMEVVKFLVKFGVVNEEEFNENLDSRKKESERRQKEHDYEKYLKLKERFEES